MENERDSPSDSISELEDFEVVQPHEAQLPKEELDKILKWLKPTSYEDDSSEFNRHLLSRAPGTGVWIRETERFRQWHDSPKHGSIWIKGPPGAGKSVLAASMVQHLRSTEGPDTPVLFFFFRHIILANRHARGLMQDWLAQLLPCSITLQGTLLSMTKTRLADVSDDHLWECLLKGLSGVPKAYCIVDAMDEGADNTAFLHHLNRLATFRPAAVKVFMTSRPRQDLQSTLSAAFIVHISLEEDRVGKEIEVFIAHRLAQSMKPLPAQSCLAKEIATRSRGLFLYARLLIDQILPGLQVDNKVDINSLPIHLEDMYNHMLVRQAEETGVSTDVQAAILASITHSVRPLRLRELAGFLDNKLQTGPLERSKQIARVACHPLVQILEDETVQVIHHSFSEFLLDTGRNSSPAASSPQFPALSPPQIHKEMAITCLNVVSLALGLKTKDSEAPSTCLPFYNYANDHWRHHVSCVKQLVDPDLISAIESFTRTRKEHARQWEANKEHWIPAAYYERYQTKEPLQIAAEAGMLEYSRQLLSREPRLSSFSPEIWKQSWSDEPLGLACVEGHVEVARILWPADDAIIIATDSLFEYTVRRGHTAVVEFLLSKGMRPILKMSAGPANRVQEAYVTATPDCLRLILPYCLDDEAWLTELLCSFAARGWDKQLVLMLSETHAVAGWSNSFGSALLQTCAAEKKSTGHVECVKALLPSFPAINKRETVARHSTGYMAATPHPIKERTLLHALVGGWNDDNHKHASEIFDLLLGAGADLEARDGLDDTPVFCLFPRSFAKSVYRPLKRLLEAGANISAQGDQGGFLMHRALKAHRDVRLLELLVTHGADVNALWQRSASSTVPPLSLVWDTTQELLASFREEGHEVVKRNTRRELAEFLVRNGATIQAGNAVDTLNQALACCDVESLRLLLKTRSIEGNIDDCIFWMVQSWHWRKEREHDDPLPFIQELVTAGASLEARDKRENGATPLLTAVSTKTMFDALVKAGAKKHALDSRGRGALFYLLDPEHWHGSDPPSIERLVELVGMFDPRQKDVQGNSLLHVALPLYQRHSEGAPCGPWLFPVLERLIEYGLSCRAQNNAGLTPLHFYFDVSFNNFAFPRRRDNPEALKNVLDFLGGTSEGIDIDAQDDEGVTPLHLAAVSTWEFAISQVKILRDHGADVGVAATDGKNALHLAARARNTAVVGFLVDHAPELISQVDCRGRTPLFDACASGIAESVASLLRAGADVSARDHPGWTPLHACSEFMEEQRKWTTPEAAARVHEHLPFDRYRPYQPHFHERFTNYFALEEVRENHDEYPYVVENSVLAIWEVAKALLAAGANSLDVAGDIGATPAQRAYDLECTGVLLALEEFGASTPQLESLDDEGKQNILRAPWDSIARYTTPRDIEWLREHDANFNVNIRVEDGESYGDDGPFRRVFSFMEAVALTGLTSVMSLLGDAARHYENPETPIDRWTLALIAANPRRCIGPSKRYGSWRSNVCWDPELDKTVGDYYTRTEWKVNPLLYVTCERSCPNLEMLRVLVEHCGVDVNGKSARYVGRSDHTSSVQYAGILQLLASKQLFWHLDAIRYLVGRGADVNSADQEGMTALHHACASNGMWTYRFVKLLLELGADPFQRDSQGQPGRTSVDVTQSAAAFQAIVDHGVELGDSLNQNLWLAIGRLNIDLVLRALDFGADVNRWDEGPAYILDPQELDHWIHCTPLSEGYPAAPLYGALLYTDYKQDRYSPDGKDSRAAIIRLLMDRGADPFTLIRVRKEERDVGQYKSWMEPTKEPLLHGVFRHVRCPRQYLEIFFEFAERIDFNTLDGQGDTAFLAACDSGIDWYEDPAFRPEEQALTEGIIDQESEKEWDASGLFLRMLYHGADITALRQDGDNALHVLLSNSGMMEEHILAFLARPESHPLARAKNHEGFTAVQLALRTLRPKTVETLLALGTAGSLTDGPDPDGLGPLHRIAAQCLLTRVPRPGGESRWLYERLLPQRPDFLDSCKRLWAACLAVGLDVDGPDATPARNPPLFHYLAHHASNLPRPGSSYRDFTRDATCHMRSLDAFFGGANLRARNAVGETALHVVARHAGLDRVPYPSHDVCRGSVHDAEVFRVLMGERGLDPLLVDEKGFSSLDVASQDQRVQILDMVKQR